MACDRNRRPLPTTARWPRSARAAVVGLAVLAGALLTARPVLAQQYHAEPIDEKARALRPIAQNCVKVAARFAADRERFREFFEKYYFPAMTQFSPAGLAALGQLRYELFSIYLWPATSPELQKELTELAFAKLWPVAFPRDRQYHPAVRYNAILVLGMLDEQYPIDAGANRRPSKPYKEANKRLVQFVDHAAKGNMVEPSLLVGALVGLERHAQNRASLERTEIEAMTAALLKLATLEPLVPQADRPVSNWIRLQTAIVLAKLGSPGADGAVHATLLKMIAGESEPKLPLDARCQIGALLGLIDYQGATVDGKATADAVLKLVQDVTADEVKTAQEFEEAHVGAGFGSVTRRRGRGRVQFSQLGDQIEYERSTLLSRLTDVRRTLEVTKPLVPTETQATFDAILTAIRPVADAAADPDEVGLQLAQKVREMANAVQQAVNPSAAPVVEESVDVF